MAGVRVTVEVQTTKLLNPRVFRRAIERAARKGGISGMRRLRAEAKRAVREVKAMKAKAVSQALTTRRTGRRLEQMRFALNVADQPLRVADYRWRQTRKGVSVRINRSKMTRIRSAFGATMPSGHRGVFKRRKGAKRLPIDEQRASRVLDAMLQKPLQTRVGKAGGRVMRDTTARLLPGEIERLKRRTKVTVRR